MDGGRVVQAVPHFVKRSERRGIRICSCGAVADSQRGRLVETVASISTGVTTSYFLI